MYPYYALLTVSVILFGITFFMNNRYQKASGSTLWATVIFSLISGSVGLLCLLIINRFQLGVTPFTLLMAAAASLNSLLYTFCSLKAFQYINLSLYSLFAMLGGMVLPFLQGIFFYREPMTFGKGVCILLIVAALLLTVERGEKKRRGWIFYVGVFVLNGMSGVLSKMFQSAPYEKANAASYSIWMAIISTTVAALLLLVLCLKKKSERVSLRAVLYSAGFGALNRVANYLLLIALAVLPASVQYPFITGGVMVVSTAISPMIGQRPSFRELLSVGLAFLGVLALVLIP